MREYSLDQTAKVESEEGIMKKLFMIAVLTFVVLFSGDKLILAADGKTIILTKM
jgi:hypothetical protein